MSTLTAEQRIQRAHVRIMGHPSTLAFSGLVMVGTSVKYVMTFLQHVLMGVMLCMAVGL
jgi:hypothetical protein